jgi:hypothetical protein
MQILQNNKNSHGNSTYNLQENKNSHGNGMQILPFSPRKAQASTWD